MQYFIKFALCFTCYKYVEKGVKVTKYSRKMNSFVTYYGKKSLFVGKLESSSLFKIYSRFLVSVVGYLV